MSVAREVGVWAPNRILPAGELRKFFSKNSKSRGLDITGV
jgi:hypothetical protein